MSGFDRARIELVVQTSARLSLKRAKIHFPFQIADFRNVVRRGVHAKKGHSCDTGAPDNNPRTTTSEQMHSGRSGEGYSALRDWRPIPAALHSPIRPTLFRGRRPSLSPTGQNFPDEVVSIGKTTSYVKQKSQYGSAKLFLRANVLGPPWVDSIGTRFPDLALS